MIEYIKHILGICGENHPSLITMLFGFIPGIPYIILIVKSKFKQSKKK